MIDRRVFMGALTGGLLAAPHAVGAQPGKKAPHVGLLYPLSRPQVTAVVDALEAGFRDLGYVPGKNIDLDYRWAEGKAERLPVLAAELVSLKVDLIVTVATQATLAAKSSTTTIPIVMVYVADPVGTGIVSSLAHPGGNVTGLGVQWEELSAKLPELIKEAFPRTSRVAVLADPNNPGYTVYRAAIGDAARKLGLQLAAYDTRTLDELEAAFPAMIRDRVHALVVPIQPFTYQHRQRITDLAAKHRLPAIYGVRLFVQAGGLMSYGVNENDVHRRAAYFVDRILKGAKPADLPVERPTRFELVINLRTARALDLVIQPALLGRADEVIQ